MDLVALATVADVVPLTGANRILVHHGLAGAEPRVAAPACARSRRSPELEADSPVTAGQVGFRLGPRINAAGRLDDASLGLQLLCSETLDAARPLAQVLDQANAERQGIESSILAEALAQAEERAEQARGLVLYAEGWHPGVVGIVASRVVERFHRPTVMVGVQDGVGKGSARSIEGFHLYDALGGCAEHLLAASAATSTPPASPWTPKHLPAFREAFERIARQRLTPEDLIPRCKVDAVVGVSELDERAVEALQRLGPFGQGNPEPVLVLRHQVARPRVLPHKSGGAGHLKLALVDAPAVDAIGFGMADRLSLTEGPVDLAFQASFDTFRGQRRLSLKLKDLRAAA